MTAADRPSTPPCRTGRDARPTCRPRSARSRPRCAPGSPPPAAPSRRSSRSSSSASRPQVDEITAARAPRRDRLAGHRLRRHRRRHRHRRATGEAAPPRLPGRARPLRPRPGPATGTATSSTTSRATSSSRTTAAPATTSSAASAPSPRSTRSTGRPAQMQARQSERMAARPGVPQQPVEARVRRRAVVRPEPRLALPRPDPPPSRGRRLGRPRHPPRPRHPRPVDDPAPTSRRSGTCSTAPSSSTTRGTPPTAPPARSTPAPPCARRSAPSRAGPRCPTWTTTRASCTPCPIPEAMAYLMLRPLLADVPDDDMCGVTVNQVFPASQQWHALLMEALAGIPDVKAGDSVWWHCDMIHSVAPVEDQQGWGNVMYIPAAPWCPRNEAYAASVRDAFLTGVEPERLPRRALRARLAQPLPAGGPQRHRPPRSRSCPIASEVAQPRRYRLRGWRRSNAQRK